MYQQLRPLLPDQGLQKVSSQHLDATEDLEIVVMSAEETKKLMAEGGLVQAVHVAAMYYAEKILNK